MKRVLIIEDKKEIRESLKSLIENIQSDIIVFMAEDSENAYRIALEHDIDVFLIDIILKPEIIGDVSGLTFAHSVRKLQQYKFTPMIFVTSLEDPQMQAYRELRCFGYLEKPYKVDETIALLREALEYQTKREEGRIVSFRKDGIFYLKKLNEIIYVKSTSGKVMIKTVDDELEIYYKTSKQMLKELDSDNFIRCSRTVIVNKQYIDSVDTMNRYICLKNGYGMLEIGTKMKKAFLEEMFHD